MKRSGFVVGGVSAAVVLAAVIALLNPFGASAVTPSADLTVAATKKPKVVGYYTNWATYRGAVGQVKQLHTSGAAAKLTHIVYAFGSVENGRCGLSDEYADHQKRFTAAQSVSGRADQASQKVAGNFNQLRQLKKKHPKLKVLWSFGGGSGSAGFTQAALDPTAFARSCRALVEDRRWADVFDGIDIDWEYPNACNVTCDASGYNAYPVLLKAVRRAFGTDLVTSAITGDGQPGGTLSKANYALGAKYLNWIMPMTYDYHGTWEPEGPTAPHSPLGDYPSATVGGYDSKTVIANLRAQGVPSRKLLLGVPFYGRGWTGVTQKKPGGAATGPAKGTFEAGIESYNVLAKTCPPTGVVGGTAYAKCGRNWWSYDTPKTIAGKMKYAKNQKLGGAFYWDFSGDTAKASLTKAIAKGLK
ncbi:glycoside hydrolase family 18 protein [Kineosporia rhizophila]|uniref:glycoside hydrolase family 18 protein n=1 Tax=Kineosporia rhizophila TaxID=84633 RepID=UPI001E399790|nr:glycoside hydrolase family 18 protein [Kineosporia rhizophila]